MAGAVFERLSGKLYRLITTASDGHIGAVYFVLPTDPGQATLALGDTWALTGSYIFTPAPFEAELDTIVLLVNERLAGSGMTVTYDHPPHAFVWITEPPMSGSPIVWPTGWVWIGFSWQGIFEFGQYYFQVSASCYWAQLGLDLTPGGPFPSTEGVVARNGNDDGFIVSYGSPSGANMTLAGQQMTIFYLNDQWIINIPLTGPTTGGFNFIIGVDYKQFVESLGLGLIYVYNSNQALYFPTFPRPKVDDY